MNRNDDSHFSLAPQIDIQRSKFDRPFNVKLTMNAGELVPFFIDEVLPGDTFSAKTSSSIRQSTMIKPVMDNAFFDYYYFFVPGRLVWDHWKEFFGENTESAWIPTTEYTIPQMKFTYTSNGTDSYVPANVPVPGGALDYLGFPISYGPESSGPNGLNNRFKTRSDTDFSWSHLPVRAYCLVWNEFFRDQNIFDPVVIEKGETTITCGASGGFDVDTYVTEAQRGNILLPVAKTHDYFTSALPSPQKGPASEIVLSGGNYPVNTAANATLFDSEYPLKFSYNTTNNSGQLAYTLRGVVNGGTPEMNAGEVYVDPKTYSGSAPSNPEYPNQDWANHIDVAGTNLVTTIDQVNLSINSLRQAIVMQHFLEQSARGGTRYTEIVKSFFGVTSPDARLQRPEYLGGQRVYINKSQVVQMSATDSESPQGNVSAFSHTVESSGSYSKSFTEHGYIIGVCCIRTDHTYQQGLERLWSRKTKFDFYFPTFANIGEQAILNKELYCTNDVEQNEEPFGYQEAWAEYRYKPSRVCGEFRSEYYGRSLDFWHYADVYKELPTLSPGWLRETKTNIDRTLAVTSDVSNQFIADIYVDQVCTRPMPVYSIPGLSRI